MKQNAWHTPQPDVLYYLELADHLKCGADFLLHFKFHTFASFFYAVYKEAAKTMSRLMMTLASSIFWCSTGSPITFDAFRMSRHVSSNLTMHRTMEPSCTSVKSVISANGMPLACRKSDAMTSSSWSAHRRQHKKQGQRATNVEGPHWWR